MVATYERHGIRFLYPENWDLQEDSRGADTQCVTLQSPGGGFWMLQIVETQQSLERLVAEDRNNRQAQLGLAQTYLLLGDVLERLGRTNGAERARTQALEAVEPFARGSQETEFLAVWAAALVRTGRMDDAEPIIDSLLGRGYREPEFVALAKASGMLTR